MSKDSESRFSGDKPVADRKHDLLDRAPLADRIAGLIDSQSTMTSLVVGIFGPWGSGKTTVLNLLRNNLLQMDSVVVRDFNPWRLSKDSAILLSFFSVLSDAIKKRPSSKLGRIWAWVWSKIRSALRGLAWPVSKLLKLWKPSAAEVADDLLKAFGAIAASPDSVEIESQRNRIVRRLQQFDKRIVILIDDIDRLDKVETQLLFRVIKACADFPSVSYVLAFDEEMVAQAIGERYGDEGEVSGRRFLEKIVQVPVELPVPARVNFRKLVLDQLDLVLKLAGLSLTDDQVREFLLSFDPVIGTRLTTPRHAKRLRNALMFDVAPLVGESHPVDLLLIEVVRVFFPEAYLIVCNHHSDFSGIEEERNQGRNDGTRCVVRLESVLKCMQVEHVVVVKDILMELFPRLRGAYNNIIYGSENLVRWSREQRISSPEYCSRYFMHSIPPDDIAHSEMSAMIAIAENGDLEELTTRISSHFSGPRAGRTIEEFRKVESKLDPLTARTLAIAVAKNVERLPNQPALLPFAEPPSRAAILISHLLQTILDRDDRVSVMESIIEAAKPLWFAAECLRWCRVTDDPEKESKNTLTKQEMDRTIQVLVQRVKKRAELGHPLFDPTVRQELLLLVAWRRSEGRGPVQSHLVSVFEKDPNQVSRFLRSEVPLAWGMEDDRKSISDLAENELENIEFLIDLDTLVGWVRKCCPSNLDDPQYHFHEDAPVDRRLAEQFMLLYNQRTNSE